MEKVKVNEQLEKASLDVVQMPGAHDEKRKFYVPGFIQKLKNYVSLGFVASAALLVVFGLIVCKSAVDNNATYSFLRQLLGMAAGILIGVFLAYYDYRCFSRFVYPLLALNVFLILLPHVPGIGVTAMGATSWVKIGIQFQPGEFAKISVILFAASLVARYQGRLDNFRIYIKVLALLAIPFLCIMTQPDLGTGLVYLVISAVVLYCGGAKSKYIVGTIVAMVVLFVCVLLIDEALKTQNADGTFEYKLIKNYQRSRLFVFLNQDSADATGDAYNLKQAMITIGSGGFFGKGLGASTQAALGFLPEAPTDFIFCVLAEELGFVGVITLLGLFALLIFGAIKIAKQSGDFFGMLIIVGIVGMWVFQVLENVGMCAGLMPITGIPLPFVSYGSSFMVVNFACLGLISSVYRQNNMKVEV